jgi:hypothetical protein
VRPEQQRPGWPPAVVVSWSRLVGKLPCCAFGLLLALGRFRLGETCVPFLEALAAVLQQFIVTFEEYLKVLPRHAVEFTVVVGVIAADLRACLIDAAAPIGLQVRTGIVDQQKPAVIVLEQLHVLMRYLPQQHVEIRHGAGCVDILGDIGAAGGVGAVAAFVLGGQLDPAQGLDGDDGGHGGFRRGVRLGAVGGVYRRGAGKTSRLSGAGRSPRGMNDQPDFWHTSVACPP